MRGNSALRGSRWRSPPKATASGEDRLRRYAGARCAFAASLLLLSVATAAAQDKITLKLGGVVSPTHYMVTACGKFWMDKVTELTKGRVQFEYFPAEQLGKAGDMLGLAQAGVIDIAE